MLFTAFVSGIIGSRLFYVLENLSYYLENPLEAIMLQHGGLSWYGGIFLGCAATVLYIRKKQLPLYKTLDLVMPFVALGQSIGRIGCFLNGCCYGKPSVFGLYFPVLDAQLIPTQVYSSLAALAIFTVLRILQDKPHKKGEILFIYFALYSFKRLLIEFWRADNPVMAFGLTLFQMISIVVFIISVWKIYLIRKNGDGSIFSKRSFHKK